MLGFEALRFGNARNIGLGSLWAVTGPAKDLQIVGFVCPAKGYGQGQINDPKFAGQRDFDSSLI
jgi:hypothetical protein